MSESAPVSESSPVSEGLTLTEGPVGGLEAKGCEFTLESREGCAVGGPGEPAAEASRGGEGGDMGCRRGGWHMSWSGAGSAGSAGSMSSSRRSPQAGSLRVSCDAASENCWTWTWTSGGPCRGAAAVDVVAAPRCRKRMRVARRGSSPAAVPSAPAWAAVTGTGTGGGPLVSW